MKVITFRGVSVFIIGLLSLTLFACAKNSLMGGNSSASKGGNSAEPSPTSNTQADEEGKVERGSPQSEEFTAGETKRQHDILVLSSLTGAEPQAAQLLPLMDALIKKLPTEGFDYKFTYAGMVPLTDATLLTKYDAPLSLSEELIADKDDLLASLTRALADDEGYRPRPGSQLQVVLVSVNDRTPDKVKDDDGVLTPTYLDVNLPREALIHGILPMEAPKPDAPNCQYQSAKEYISFSTLHYGSRVDVCRKDWDTIVTLLATRLLEQGKRYALRRLPDVSKEITVTINDQALDSSRYTIDEISWHLVLNEPAKAGDIIKISYIDK